MDTFKIFFQTYKQMMLGILISLGFYSFTIVLQLIIAPDRGTPYDGLWFVPLMIVSYPLSIFHKTLYEKRPLHLLPVSLRNKFFIPLGFVLAYSAITVLLTLPVEAVAMLLTNASGSKIMTGKFIHYIMENNSLIFVYLVFFSFTILMNSLVLDKKVLMTTIVVMVFSIMQTSTGVLAFLRHPTDISTGIKIGCVAVSLILVELSFQIYKRWQSANDGIFRI